ncbi:MAG: hypothetical protein EOM65_16535, partial [Synergistales bacterium]|nr:hypothetical protein [Synergistales bacterium]
MQNQDTERGIAEHQDASEGFQGALDQERSVLEWHFSLLISLAVLVNLTLVFLIFLPSMPLAPKRYILLGMTLLWMLYTAAQPHVAVLGRVPGMSGFHNLADYPEAKTIPGLLLYRFDGDILFFNAYAIQLF